MSKKVQTFYDYMQSRMAKSSSQKLNKRGKIAKGDYETGLFGGGQGSRSQSGAPGAAQAAAQAAAQRAAQQAQQQAQQRADAEANQRAAQARASQQTQQASQPASNGAAAAAQAAATRPVYSANTGNGASVAAQNGNTRDAGDIARDRRRAEENAAIMRRRALAAAQQNGTSLGAQVNGTNNNGIGQQAYNAAADFLRPRNVAYAVDNNPGGTNGTQTLTPTLTGSPVPIAPTNGPVGTITPVDVPPAEPIKTPTRTPFGTQPTIEDANIRLWRDNTLAGLDLTQDKPRLKFDKDGIPVVDFSKEIYNMINPTDTYAGMWRDSGGISRFPFDLAAPSPTAGKKTPTPIYGAGRTKLINDDYPENLNQFREFYPSDISKVVARKVLDIINYGTTRDGNLVTNIPEFSDSTKQEIEFQAKGGTERGFSPAAWKEITNSAINESKNYKTNVIPKSRERLAEAANFAAGNASLWAKDPAVWDETMGISPNQIVNANYAAGNIVNEDRNLTQSNHVGTRVKDLNEVMNPSGNPYPTPNATEQNLAYMSRTPKPTLTPRPPLPSAEPVIIPKTKQGGGGTQGGTQDGTQGATAYPVPEWAKNTFFEPYFLAGNYGKGTQKSPVQVYPGQPTVNPTIVNQWATARTPRYIRNPNITNVPYETPTPTVDTFSPQPPEYYENRNASATAEGKKGLTQTAQATKSGIFNQTMTPTAPAPTQTPAPTAQSQQPEASPQSQVLAGLPNRYPYSNFFARYGLNPYGSTRTAKPAGRSSQIITTTPTPSVSAQPTQTRTQTATPTTQAAMNAVQQEIAQLLNNQRLNQQQASLAYPQFAPKQARMSSRKKAGKLKKDIGVGAGLTAHATQPVAESPMPKIRTSYGSYKFKKPQEQQRSAKYGEDQQIHQPMRKQIDAAQPRQTMSNVMQFPPSDAFQPFEKIMSNSMEKYTKNDLTKSLQKNPKYNNAYSANKKYE